MTRDALVDVLRYNKWANIALYDACAGLSDAQLDATAAGTTGTLRTLLTHIAGGQQTFILRTKGRHHEGELNRASAWPGFDALRAIIEQSSDELVAIGGSDDVDADVDLPYMGKTYRYPRSFFLTHAIAHGIEHRTEVCVIMRTLGVPPPDLDGWPYAAAAGFGVEVA
jgi:uncharacterized damage-inducible protein DinB